MCKKCEQWRIFSVSGDPLELFKGGAHFIEGKYPDYSRQELTLEGFVGLLVDFDQNGVEMTGVNDPRQRKFGVAVEGEETVYYTCGAAIFGDVMFGEDDLVFNCEPMYELFRKSRNLGME